MSERLRGSERLNPQSGARDRERTASKARRRRILWAVVLFAMVVAGAVLAATSKGSIARSAGAIVLLGGAAVLVVSLAFLEVGLSEDRERRSRFGRPERGGDVDPDQERRSERFFR